MINFLVVILQMSMQWCIATPLMKTSHLLKGGYYILVMLILIMCLRNKGTSTWIKILIKLITRIISTIILNNFFYLNLKQLTLVLLFHLLGEVQSSVREIKVVNKTHLQRMEKGTSLKKLSLEIKWGVVNYANINKYKIK